MSRRGPKRRGAGRAAGPVPGANGGEGLPGARSRKTSGGGAPRDSLRATSPGQEALHGARGEPEGRDRVASRRAIRGSRHPGRGHHPHRQDPPNPGPPGRVWPSGPRRRELWRVAPGSETAARGPGPACGGGNRSSGTPRLASRLPASKDEPASTVRGAVARGPAHRPRRPAKREAGRSALSRAGLEAAHGIARASGRRIDEKPGQRDGLLGVPVRVTSARERRPGWLRPVLHPGFPADRRADVLERPKHPSDGEDPAYLAERLAGIGHRAEDEAAHHGVECRPGERASASARAWTSKAAGARLRARARLSRQGSTATALVPEGRSGRLRPVPQPRSRVSPRAPSASQRRQGPSPARSSSAIEAS